MDTQDYLLLQGKRYYLPGFTDILDMPGDSMNYNELENPSDLMEWVN